MEWNRFPRMSYQRLQESIFQPLATKAKTFGRWHIDCAMYNLDPPLITALRAITLPKGPEQTLRWYNGSGTSIKVKPGLTAFYSCEQQYAMFSLEERAVVDNSTVLYAPHPYQWISKCKQDSIGLSKNAPGAEVRVVDNVDRVRRFLFGLMRRMIEPENILIEPYQEGDVAVWDNRVCLCILIIRKEPMLINIDRVWSILSLSIRPRMGPVRCTKSILRHLGHHLEQFVILRAGLQQFMYFLLKIIWVSCRTCDFRQVSCYCQQTFCPLWQAF